MSNKPRIEVFFDGACPICSREMAMIRALDQNQDLQCTDIADCNFNANAHGLNASAVNQKIHARLGDGQIVTGVEVFRQIYGVLGFRRSVAWSRRPWVAKVLDHGYAIFAKYRRYIALPLRWARPMR